MLLSCSPRKHAVSLFHSRAELPVRFSLRPCTTTRPHCATPRRVQIYYAAATASNGTKGFPAGVCPNVGVGGHVPGGGLGYLTRAYGLACDQVLAVKMVSGPYVHEGGGAVDNATDGAVDSGTWMAEA